MLLIKNGRVIDPASGLDELSDIIISENQIQDIGNFEDDGSFERVIFADGMVVAPGLVDVHVHFRDPGFTYKEDIYTGAQAAAAGGYTTVVCMANTKPAIDNAATYTDLAERQAELPIKVKQAANVTMGMQGQKTVDFEELYNHGVPGFTDDGLPIMNEEILNTALKEVKKLDVPISLHEEDPKYLKSQGVNEGPVAEYFGVGGASRLAEESMVERDIRLNAGIGAKLDIQHVSSAGTVDIIRKAKADGITVYAEVTPQHLSLNETALYKVGTLGRVNPPIRTEEDRLALIQGLCDGTLDMIATDHAPHAAFEKEREFAKAPSGMIGLETALALCITNVVRPGYLSLNDLLAKMTVNPATLYGFDAGYLAVGGPADLVIFDPEEKWTVTEDDFHSKSHNSPFIGDEVYGRVHMTISDGKVVYNKEL